MNVEEFLGAEQQPDGSWVFHLGKELNGAFGGVNGGVLTAASLLAARSLAEGRRPTSIDSRYLRGVTPGAARVHADLVHEGRTLSCVSIDIFDERDRLCTRSTATFVTPEALADLDDEGQAGVPEGWKAVEDGRLWAQPGGDRAIPLIDTFQPTGIGRDERGVATAIRIPWDEGQSSAEAACIAADISVGPPVAHATRGKPIPTPNPDLSLRFCAEVTLPGHLTGAARLDRVANGVATTRIEVRSALELVATGISTTTMLGGAWPNASKKPK